MSGASQETGSAEMTTLLLLSLHAELSELRVEVLRRRRDLLEAPQPASRKVPEAGRTRTSFVEYVSEVWPHSR